MKNNGKPNLSKDKRTLYRQQWEFYYTTKYENRVDIQPSGTSFAPANQDLCRIVHEWKRKPTDIAQKWWYYQLVPGEPSEKFTDKQHLKEYYGDPCVYVTIKRVTLVVEEDDKHVRLAFYYATKSRTVGSRYFRAGGRKVSFLTYNKQRKCFYMKNIHGGLVCNPFRVLDNLTLLFNSEKVLVHLHGYISGDTIHFKEQYTQPVLDAINAFLTAVGGFTIVREEALPMGFYSAFLKVHNLPHVPHQLQLFKQGFPGVALLKKYDSYRAILTKKKMYHRYLHHLIRSEDVHLYHLELLYKFFGDIQFLREVPVHKILNFTRQQHHSYNMPNIKLSGKQKWNMVRLLQTTTMQITDFFPYFNAIRDYNASYKRKVKILNTTDPEKFFRTYNQTIMYARFGIGLEGRNYLQYNEGFVKEIQQPVGRFYPVVLQYPIQFLMEQAATANPVFRYASHTNTLIISLRHADRNSYDRIDIRFYLLDKPMFLYAIHSYGNKVPDYFTEALEIVKEKVYDYADRYGLLNPISVKQPYEKPHIDTSDSPF